MMQEWQMEPQKFESHPPPPPGSKRAVEMGCTCCPLANNTGWGVTGSKGLYRYTAGCPIHPIKGGW